MFQTLFHCLICPITIELTLVSDATEPLVTQSAEFTTTDTSFLWNIEAPIITADVHRLDDGLFAEYAEILENNPYLLPSTVFQFKLKQQVKQQTFLQQS